MPTSESQDDGLRAGELFAGYTIVRRLGVGGMGEVYLAQHPRLPRRDALKILPAELTVNQEYRQRFNREAELAATLYHEHIVGIHDRGEYHGQLWLSMDYVEGTDAARLVQEHFPSGMPLPDVVQIVAAVADALDYAHSRGLLHRDIKPANILLGEAGPRRRIVLADFGVARELDQTSGLTATNMTMGTTAYCAPEQLLGSVLDGRVDQYALACTTYQLLTGVAPFDHSSPAAIVTQHLSAPPPLLSGRRPDLPHLDPVMARALAKDPAARFASCTEFAAALAAPPGLVPGPPLVVAGPTRVIPVPPPPASGGGHATLIATLAAIALVGVAVILGVVAMSTNTSDRAAGPSSPVSTTSRSAEPPGSSASASPPPGLRLNPYLTDEAHVLKPAERDAVDAAVDNLRQRRGIRLWVVYVKNFGGLNPARWADREIHDNEFSDNDALLGIATDSRTFIFQVATAITTGRPIDVEEIGHEHIAPAVAKRDWVKAALAATNGLDVD
ncbi:serine/threonine-protein kinase [Mycobacterium vicinigordonae]|uniref:non-specific serine/threonine protein kinase n=1 Tax=Mycobacterium vicinigordonae TaxID=1719132 RepID=A0A7D6I8J2_9MYCO|nr:serine/threonine-protein kinase [Mycobacterium vicinigordonae]QLL09698.1 protein kinase [Mycobacterium vicinigordonae]